jgi:hypothetical protein
VGGVALMPRTSFRSGRSGVEISTTGLRAQVALMRKLGVRGADVRPAYDEVEVILREQGEEQWKSRGHAKWPKLEDATLEARRRRGGSGDRIMYVSGFLYTSLTGKKPRTRWRRARKDELRWGTKVFYAYFQQEGSGIPVRKVLDITEAAQRDINTVLGNYITYGDPRKTR